MKYFESPSVSPTRIDMDTSDFEEQFMLAVKGSIDSGSQDHDWRYVYTDFTSFHEAQECEYKLKTIMRA